MNSSQNMAQRPSEGERLSKRVMQLRDCSRREAEQYIEAGFVRVDGVVVQEPQFRVSQQKVALDAHASLPNLLPVTLIVNKPAGWTDGLTPLPVARPVQPGRKPEPARPAKGPQNVRQLLTPEHHSKHDHSGVRFLKSHLTKLDASVPLEYEASGLVAFTQDFRVQRKLMEDMAFIEQELMVDVRGEVTPEALRPIERAMRDERLRLPDFKISVGSANPGRSKLRLAVKGSHLGLAVYLCELSGLEILALRRIRLGRVSLGDLEEGAWRYLAEGERF
ncbi:RNA pseudouridine synthase [Limnohabitans sp.]|uniref:RNA pseudouridine synthase n=1 Tax=Limnohabitans sp. TaxID=1907725 RepID=UPI00286EE8FB|nr:RNA pseudouridine synthase [Limnohabitans sp.]